MKLGKSSLKKMTDIAIAASLVFAFWHFLAIYVSNDMLPTPIQAVSEFFISFPSTLWSHFYISAFRVSISIALATMLAVPLGLFLGREERLDRYAAPMIYLIYPIPKIVFLPIVLLFFGLGDSSKVFMIGFIIFFQILVTARDAARGVPMQNIYSMASLGASKGQIFYHVIWPACLPKILTSLRISLGTAVAVLFFVESFATTEGLGYYIMDSWSMAAYSRMFAGIMGMSTLGLLLYIVLDLIEAIWCRWQRL